MTSKELNEILNKTRRTKDISLSVEQVEELVKDLEVLDILKPNLSATLFNKEDETGIIYLAQININKNSSQEEKDNFYKVRDYLRKS